MRIFLTKQTFINQYIKSIINQYKFKPKSNLFKPDPKNHLKQRVNCAVKTAFLIDEISKSIPFITNFPQRFNKINADSN